MSKNKGVATLYTEGYIDFTKEPMFFGQGKNLQRFDVFKHEIFDTVNEKMQSFFWRPQEVDLQKDANDMKSMEEHEVHITTRTIQKIEFLDSIMGRGPMLTFGQIVSIPELENAILTWDFFEGAIHSKSYSWILQNCYTDPTAIFDEVHDIKELQKIAKFISGPYNEFYNDVIEYQYMMSKGNKPSDAFMKQIKTSLLRLLMIVNCLEGIEFLSSFSAMWALTEAKGLVAGNSKILQFIARDELQHLRLTQHMNKLLRDNEDEGFKDLWASMTTEFYGIYEEACNLEFEWIDMLYSKGSIIGMNADIAKDYVKYVTNNRLTAIGLKPMFEVTKNPLPWIDKWFNFGSTSGALQEIEATDYKLGGIRFDNVNYKV